MPKQYISNINIRSRERILVLAYSNEFHGEHHVRHLHILAQKYQALVQHQKRIDPHLYDMVCMHSGNAGRIYPRSREKSKMDLLDTCLQKFPRRHIHYRKTALSHLQKGGEVHHGATELGEY